MLRQRRETPAAHCDSGPPCTETTTGKRSLPLRLVQEHRNRLAVEAREAVQLRLDERRGIDVARAHRQPRQRVRVEVVEMDVVRLGRGARTRTRAASRPSRRPAARRRRGRAAAPPRAARASAGRAARAASSRPRSRARAGSSPRRRRRTRDPSATRRRSPSSATRGRSGGSRTCRGPRSSRRGIRRSRGARRARTYSASSSCGDAWTDLARVDLPQVQVVVAGAVADPADGDPAAVRRDARRPRTSRPARSSAPPRPAACARRRRSRVRCGGSSRTRATSRRGRRAPSRA